MLPKSASKVCVVVPIYKASPDEFERISLCQGCRVLGSHPAVFVAPQDLDCDPYRELWPQAGMERFSSNFFQSIDGYNRLMLSHEFYRRFAGYEFILIYQTDAYVFRDELLDWCQRGYDYAGALWIDLDSNGNLVSGRAGNGGFSLRKIETFLRVTRLGYRVRSFGDLLKKYLHFNKGTAGDLGWFLLTVVPKFLWFILPRLLGFRNTYGSIQAEEKIGEDRIFVHKILSNRHFRVPDLTEGIGFAWELHLEALWNRHPTLPFGGHAWSRGTYFGEPVHEFWKKHIRMPGPP